MVHDVSRLHAAACTRPGSRTRNYINIISKGGVCGTGRTMTVRTTTVRGGWGVGAPFPGTARRGEEMEVVVEEDHEAPRDARRFILHSGHCGEWVEATKHVHKKIATRL